jgi:hypothetical protein
VLESAFLKRSAPAAAEAPPAELLKDGFQLAWKDKFAIAPVHVGNTAYVYEIIERRVGTEEADAARREQIRGQLLTTTANELVSSWLSRVSEQAEVWTNTTLIQ